MSRSKFVEVCPLATIERRRTNGYETYFLVRKKKGDFMPFADGKTPGDAWRKAWERLLPRLREAGDKP